MIEIIDSEEFRVLLTQALVNGKYEITKFQNELKEKYKKAWGSSEWLDSRLAKEYTRIIVDQMLDILNEETGTDQEQYQG